ncbi:MAG: alpha/beta fold hydrolase [Streptosporangiales bacterium]|nr:alpha/beta fold hydrolase [Streptosporangiales bacterium]
MTDGKQPVGDITVAYTEQGAGPPVVFVHGLAEDRASWAVQQRELTGFRTVSVDLRGHGETTVGAAGGTLAQLGGDLVGVLDALTGPAVCVGFSLGGTVVLRAALDRPDLVRSAIVLGTSPIVGRAAVEFYGERIALVERGDAAEIRDATTSDTAAALVTDVDVDALVSARVAAIGSGAGYVNAARAMAGLRAQPLTEELANVQSPVAVVGADADSFCPRKAADILLDALPAATYHEVPGAGHLMNVDQPALVTDLLRELLAEGAGT